MLATLVAVVLLGAAAHRLARALLPRDGHAARAAVALVLGASLLCAAHGLLAQLSTRVPAEVELVFRGDPRAAPRRSTNQAAGEVRVLEDRVVRARDTAPMLLGCAALVALAALALRPRPLTPRASRSMPSWRHLLLVPIGLSAMAALLSTPRGYDALWYHLPMAAAFARQGHLEPPGRDLVFYFPGNMELLARTVLDLLGSARGARASALVQLPFALALAPLATAVARRLGAGGRAYVAGLLAIGCPIVVFQAGLGYADLVAAAALAAALLLLLDALDAEGAASWLGVLAAGLALGLALGAKYAALPLVAAGLPFVVLRRGTRGSGPRLLATSGTILLLLVGCALPSGFWYLRNLRLSGNPLFPIAVPALDLAGLFTADAFNRGKELELVATRAEWLVYPWLERLSHESGFGAGFVTLVPLSVPPLLAACARALARRRVPRLLLPLGWGLAYLATWWLGTPHEARHLLPLVVLLGPPACLLLRGPTPRALGLERAALAAVTVGALVTLRLQLFSPAPEESVRPCSFGELYGLDEGALRQLPAGARVANRAGRPYNLAVAGAGLELVPLFDEGAPPEATLDEARLLALRATHVLVRGPAQALERKIAAWRWRPRWQAPAASRRGWRFWGASDADIVGLYERLP